MTETVFGERMLITRGAIAVTSRDTAPLPEMGDGDVLFAVRRIALTANNVTYAAAGEMLGYWRFFPGPEGKGILPVWGFGEVVKSHAPEFAVGDRFYGYWPLATHLLVREAVSAPGGFMDAAPHRQGLADIYNRYQRVEPRLPHEEALDALFRPLFMTGWLIDDFLAGADDFGAEQVILSSASSKTAMAAAFNLSRRGAVQVIGLTSAANRAFTENLGSYDRVFTYDEVDTLERKPSVYVDFAGDRALTQKVHTRLGDALKHSAIVGMTHWGQGGDAPLPGPAPTLFFAPTVAEATVAKLGPAGFADATGYAWTKFVPAVREKLAVETLHGLESAESAYRDLAAGNIGGASAIVVELD
ncbi:DUF2855 family protein [Sphingosinicella microcystinivorans]|uniref:Uncharacterized protein DUF2855 n=1 Tax=Sphingosinicella microcystinivorans TaxID=335406 RepID=A0AAD1D6H1_SPHMI|nr:DUF2855 family protein [Sphingosinicella microcystinivorans]RKS91839.1 uncharacterized protein DUF2855 [Sphingosinicella microcystinivorans]BBE34823.1 hypothetical protein SmB9_24810 [Sphingosinicella microcystinivorans]